MMRLGIQEKGPVVLQPEQAKRDRTKESDGVSRQIVGLESWTRFVGKNTSAGYDFHGIFVRATASSVYESIVAKWPKGTLHWPDIANSAFFVGDHNSGQSMVPHTLLIIQLRTYPWTIITGTVNYEARRGFDPDVGILARYLKNELAADVIAVSNSGTLELVGSHPERYVGFREDDCGEAEGVTNQWLTVRGLMVPPFVIDTVDGWLRLRIEGISREEIVRIDFIRNLTVR